MKKIILLNAILLISFASCRKEGLDGNTTLVAFPQHHGKMIKGATVYVKFDATELPSNPTTNFDAKFIGEANEDHVHLKNLKWGNYFLYAVGYDSTIAQGVRGGIAKQIKYSERDETEINVNLPVSEF